MMMMVFVNDIDDSIDGRSLITDQGSYDNVNGEDFGNFGTVYP